MFSRDYMSTKSWMEVFEMSYKVFLVEIPHKIVIVWQIISISDHNKPQQTLSFKILYFHSFYLVGNKSLFPSFRFQTVKQI